MTLKSSVLFQKKNLLNSGLIINKTVKLLTIKTVEVYILQDAS